MVVVSRAKLILTAAALLAAVAAGVSFRHHVVAWVRGEPAGHQTAATLAASQPAGHDMSTMATPGERKVLYWYDPMHPAYKSDKPGIAPDCGMQLVPRYADEAEAMAGMAPGTVMLTPEKQQLIGVRTAAVERERLLRTLRTVARLEANETKIARVHVKVAGWVEEVQVDFVGKLVKQGQPLFTLYSPELVSTQQEFLIARRAQAYLGEAPYQEVARGSQALLEAARERLRLWDIPAEEIKRLEETGEVRRAVALYSPIEGFVMKRNLYPRVYVTPEAELYEIADLSTIWAYADIYEYEVPYIRVGQPATMRLSYDPGKTYTGTVSYVYPTLDPQTRTVRVRLEFPNPNFELKPEMFADVELQIDYGTQVVVPGEAVLDSGTRQLVFLARPGGYFEPREIRVGARVDRQYIILAGLKPGEVVVTSGNFLLDSESRLSAVTGGMAGMKH